MRVFQVFNVAVCRPNCFLTIAQGFVNGFIFYANVIKANEHLLIPQAQVNPLTLFISWLNLDLGIETCFFNGLNAFTKTFIQLVFPLYVWTIVWLIILSSRYSSKIAKVFGKNTVPVLATLFLLSYAKLIQLIVTALSYTFVEFPYGKVKHFDEEDKHNSCKGKWNKQSKVCVRALKTLITSSARLRPGWHCPHRMPERL